MYIDIYLQPLQIHLHLKILLIVHGDKVLSSSSVVRSVSLHNLADLEGTRLDNTASDGTSKAVGTTSNAEVGNGDLVRVAVDDGWRAEEFSVDLLVRNL